MHYGVHSRPHCVGRTSAATSAARRPHAADLASDSSDHSDASAACGRWRNGSNPHTRTIEVRNKLRWCLLCISTHNRPHQLWITMRRPHASVACVGRNASAARRPFVGRNAVDYVMTRDRNLGFSPFKITS